MSAVAGTAELMDLLAPAGPVYQAGTLSGNPAAAAAGLATLNLADDALYARLDHVGARLREMVSSALGQAGVPHRINHWGNLFSVFFTAAEVTDYDTAKTQDGAAFARFFHAMLDQGVAGAQCLRSLVRLGRTRRTRTGRDRQGVTPGCPSRSRLPAPGTRRRSPWHARLGAPILKGARP